MLKVKKNGLIPLGKKDPLKVGTDLKLPDTRAALDAIKEVEQKKQDVWVCQACGIKTNIKNSVCFPVKE